MNYNIKQTSQFKKDFKLCLKRGLNPQKFQDVLVILQKGGCLPIQYKDHPLQPSKTY